MKVSLGNDLVGRNTAGVLLVLLRLGIGFIGLSLALQIVVMAWLSRQPLEIGPSPAISFFQLAALVCSLVVYFLFMASIVAFSMWLFKACSNLALLGSLKPTYQPSMAVLLFFIPLAQLVLPVRVLVDTWKGSKPNCSLDQPLEWRNCKTPSFIYWWWAVWIFFVLTNHMLTDSTIRHGADFSEPGRIVFLAIWVLVSLPMFLFCNHYVGSVTKMQEERYGKLLVYCRDNNKLIHHHIEDLEAKARVLEPQKGTGERTVSFAGNLAVEKIAFMVCIPVYIIALISHQAANQSAYNMLPGEVTGSVFWFVVLGALYLFSGWRALFKGVKSESKGCLGIIALFVSIALVIFVSQQIIQSSYLVFWFGLFVALHLWLATIIVRDLRSFD